LSKEADDKAKAKAKAKAEKEQPISALSPSWLGECSELIWGGLLR